MNGKPWRLSEYAMILMEKQAQRRIYAIKVEAMQEIEDWTKRLTALRDSVSMVWKKSSRRKNKN